MRIGNGYDVHPLVENRKLLLGGVQIPFHLGLAGYSDADVLVHAIMDALLGAAALGDIGQHFPPQDPAYRDISSLVLLGRVRDLLRANGLGIANVDSIVVAERPRIAPFVLEMRENIAKTLGVDPARISVKATTTEGLGFTGRGEGIAAMAVALLE
ncbi:MAG: 2-C-methyl-D-erythritol 2,4-cyclodiphosphate synthase [Chloroflexi bacterium]|nr:2-C-methyl-D-erythritol 2,4-cyclodiphosphate synthase [Chloroflexota bacterium]